ncbi:GNAT family N-acetyltransferase [Amycolatopsis sp. VS8301801F10]|uniref:GNAT family N-acetyltransferase n=1 Tax=unclassified Amycolatopsis TaxID=2618356 RepID=UPI0038FC15F7
MHDQSDAPPVSRLDLPIRPALRHECCLNGHRLDIAGRNASFNPNLWEHHHSCNVCSDLHLPRTSWLEVDLTLAHEQVGNGRSRLRLVARPPSTAAGVGQIALEVRGEPVGDVDVQLCAVDRLGVIEQVRVDEDCRRRGVGSLLVAAALSRGPGYGWSTTVLDRTPRARAFWAALRTDVPIRLGEPQYCGHMLDASARDA